MAKKSVFSAKTVMEFVRIFISSKHFIFVDFSLLASGYFHCRMWGVLSSICFCPVFDLELEESVVFSVICCCKSQLWILIEATNSPHFINPLHWEWWTHHPLCSRCWWWGKFFSWGGAGNSILWSQGQGLDSMTLMGLLQLSKFYDNFSYVLSKYLPLSINICTSMSRKMNYTIILCFETSSQNLS